MARHIRRGLVLGGGGTLGAAWMIGALCALQEERGFDPRTADMIVGTSVPRLDIPNKVTGGVAYVQDIRLAGMLHGRVVRPPRPGSKRCRRPGSA